MGRTLGPGDYGLGELAVGDRFETAEAEITTALIDAFAEVSGDRFEIHMYEEAAARHGFAGRVAHGLLVLSLVDGLKNQCPVRLRAIASLGWDWAFRAPVLAGDRVRAEFVVTDMRPTSRGGRGIVTFGVTVRNQDGTTVQDGRNRLMVYA